MNQISPLATGGATMTVATLEPLVRWAMLGFPHPLPDAVPGVVAALALTVLHVIGNAIVSRNTPKQ